MFSRRQCYLSGYSFQHQTRGQRSNFQALKKKHMIRSTNHRSIKVFYLMSLLCAVATALILIYLAGGGATSFDFTPSLKAHSTNVRAIKENPLEVLRSYAPNAQPRQMGFVKQVPYRVYLYSASAFFTKSFRSAKLRNSTNKSYENTSTRDDKDGDVYDVKINVNAWVYREFVMRRATCCIKLENNRLVQIMTEKHIKDDYYFHHRNVTLLGRQFRCFLTNVTANIEKVSLEFDSTTCQDNQKSYLPVKVIQKTSIQHKGKRTIGVCLKLVYGNASASRLVEWVEAVRHLGGDFIFAYLYQLNLEARKVMEFYRDLGVVDFVDHFSFPEKRNLRRDVGVKDVRAWQDEQVVLFDCSDRLHYYHYVTVLDFDEFLIPNTVNFKNAWRSYFDKEFQKGKVGVLTFHSRMVNIEKKPHQRDHPLLLGRYTVGTASLADRNKNVFMPTRVKLPTVRTHKVHPARGFERLIPGQDGAILFHFRACKESYKEKQPLPQRILSNQLKRLLPDGLNTSLSSLQHLLVLRNENISLCEDFRMFHFRIISDFADAIVSNVIKIKRRLNIE